MRKLVVILAGVCLISGAVVADSGLVNVESAHDVAGTTDRLVRALESKGLTVFARIDHTAGAQKAGLSLAPTELVIFGNPKVGTPLMHCNRTVGIDLPQKALIWEDDSGVTRLTYNDPAYLSDRHGLAACAEVTEKVRDVLSNFSAAATKAD